MAARLLQPSSNPYLRTALLVRRCADEVRRVLLLRGLIYDCRHTFATWAIESGVHMWHLATIMGTSVAQLEDTYARWLTPTDDQLRQLLNTYSEERRSA